VNTTEKHFPKLKIGDLELDVPIIQGGMGVRISKDKLASAVSECGGMGVIASVGLGGDLESMGSEYVKISENALRETIRKAKQKTKKPIAVNIMAVLSNYESLCKICEEENVDAIISGAGLPLKLPSYVTNKHIKLIPIISSPKAADLMTRSWDKKFNRLPDAFIVEGPLAGGHLGFKPEDIENPRPLTDIVKEVKDMLSKNEKYKNIPLIAAGGIFTGKDILEVMDAGADGVQMATRFIATDECDAPDSLKQACVDAKKEDIIVIQSPVGLPGRVLKSPFVEKILKGEKIKFNCPYKCLRTCKQGESQYCIALALTNASKGNFDEGFVMTGLNAYKINKIIPVKELFETLEKEAYS